MANARINMPATAKRGEIIRDQDAGPAHRETGFRRTYLGVPLARAISSIGSCALHNGRDLPRRASSVDFRESIPRVLNRRERAGTPRVQLERR